MESPNVLCQQSLTYGLCASLATNTIMSNSSSMDTPILYLVGYIKSMLCIISSYFTIACALANVLPLCAYYCLMSNPCHCGLLADFYLISL